MTLTFQQSIVSDFSLVVDGLETIIVTLNNNIPEQVSVTNAHRSEMSRRIAQYSNVTVEDDDIPWSFPANEFNPVQNPAEIRNKNLITDAAGIIYIVQSAQLVVLRTVWLVITRRKTP